MVNSFQINPDSNRNADQVDENSDNLVSKIAQKNLAALPM